MASKPSPWLEPRRDDYKDHLLTVSRDGRFDAWIQFFAEGIKHQAIDAVRRIGLVLTIRDEILEALRSLTDRPASSDQRS